MGCKEDHCAFPEFRNDLSEEVRPRGMLSVRKGLAREERDILGGGESVSCVEANPAGSLARGAGGASWRSWGGRGVPAWTMPWELGFVP